MSKNFTHRSVIVGTFPRPETWRGTKRNVIGCFTCQSYGLLGGPWPFKAAKVPRPSAISLKVWLCETIYSPISWSNNTVLVSYSPAYGIFHLKYVLLHSDVYILLSKSIFTYLCCLFVSLSFSSFGSTLSVGVCDTEGILITCFKSRMTLKFWIHSKCHIFLKFSMIWLRLHISFAPLPDSSEVLSISPCPG